MNIIIRKARNTDINSLVENNILMAKETEDIVLDRNTVKKGVKYILQNPQFGFYLVAEIGSITVGSLMITPEWSDWRNKFFWWIQSVYISKDFRNRGIYKTLYNEIVSLADNNDICGIKLYVDKKNLSAQKVYKKLGMEENNYLLFEAVQ